MAGRQVFQSGASDSEQIVAAVPVKFRVLRRHHRVHKIARQLVVRNGLAVLDVDLAEYFVVPIENDTGRFHLLESA